jgi:hypothetical protein
VAVGEHQQERPRSVVGLELERQMDGVAERRRTAADHGAERGPDRPQVAGHRHPKIRRV